jgi:hypothetical protein
VRVTAGGARRVGFVDGGNGFAGQSSRRVHFGLGDAERIEKLELWWPDGEMEELGPLAAGNLYRVRQGEGKAVVMEVEGTGHGRDVEKGKPVAASEPQGAGTERTDRQGVDSHGN